MADKGPGPTVKTRANGNRTRLRILDAAEVLFGERGFAAVSLRDITDRAGVTLALASYHFGTKDALLEEVVERRAGPLCAEREARLAVLADPDVPAILDAFFAPLFDKVTGQGSDADSGWQAYFRLLPRLSDGGEHLGLLARHYDPTGQRFLDALGAALPDVDPARITRGFAMSLHAMLAVVSQNARITTLSGGAVSASDFEESYPALLTFCAAGIERLARNP
ncbi:TetR/AcrR family transcriptional regulator [uncultured Maritimibacter sp.]|uniref:TetR/AcrR family transcriptional regulator n=1 Tax=uncultured Maritimibacter sp. TaxID=991866 RepID=UPI000A548288|nr:TetR/AcrR family transcriptional regulator [uncultured Maritimibacter sp.]